MTTRNRAPISVVLAVVFAVLFAGCGTDRPLIDQARRDLAGVLGIRVSEVEMVVEEEVIWRTSGLGCIRPAEEFPESSTVHVPGW